jgi:hypothetical protein
MSGMEHGHEFLAAVKQHNSNSRPPRVRYVHVRPYRRLYCIRGDRPFIYTHGPSSAAASALPASPVRRHHHHSASSGATLYWFYGPGPLYRMGPALSS